MAKPLKVNKLKTLMLKIWRMWNVGAVSSILVTPYHLRHLLKGEQLSINIWGVAKNLQLDGAP
jgi:hypothetical protein